MHSDRQCSPATPGRFGWCGRLARELALSQGGACDSLMHDPETHVVGATRPRAAGLHGPRAAALFVLVFACLASAAGIAQEASSTKPDAVIELWQQSWTQNADGAIVYHEKKHVRLNNDRAYGEFADPRITFNKDTDKVEVLVARVTTPDGRTLDVPPYARNEVAPRGAAGWPAFAGLRQLVLTLSGIEPGCLVELEYQVTSSAAAAKPLCGDIRATHRYPIRHREVTLSTPKSRPLSAAQFYADGADLKRDASAGGERRFTWENLPARMDEPAQPAWQRSEPRLVYSTAGNASEWAAERWRRIETAADECPLIARLAAEWTKDISDAAEKLRAIQERLAASFNFVDFDVTWRPAQLRRASQVLESNYGLPEEAAALYLALARAAGANVRPALLVDGDAWVESAPQDGFVVADLLIAADASAGSKSTAGTSGEPMFSVRHGRVRPSAQFARAKLLRLAGDSLKEVQWIPWKSADDSIVALRGKITIDESGAFSGKVSLSAGGLFASPASVADRDGQQRRISDLLQRVLPAAAAVNFTVTKLADESFEADVDVKSSGPLEQLDGAYKLWIGPGPHTSEIDVPLGDPDRITPIALPAPFSEQVQLTIEWPAGWKVESTPATIESNLFKDTLIVRQSAETSGNSLRLAREVRVTVAQTHQKMTGVLIELCRRLRNDGARLLLLRPG